MGDDTRQKRITQASHVSTSSKSGKSEVSRTSSAASGSYIQRGQEFAEPGTDVVGPIRGEKNLHDLQDDVSRVSSFQGGTSEAGTDLSRSTIKPKNHRSGGDSNALTTRRPSGSEDGRSSRSSSSNSTSASKLTRQALAALESASAVKKNNPLTALHASRNPSRDQTSRMTPNQQNDRESVMTRQTEARRSQPSNRGGDDQQYAASEMSGSSKQSKTSSRRSGMNPAKGQMMRYEAPEIEQYREENDRKILPSESASQVSVQSSRASGSQRSQRSKANKAINREGKEMVTYQSYEDYDDNPQNRSDVSRRTISRDDRYRDPMSESERQGKELATLQQMVTQYQDNNKADDPRLAIVTAQLAQLTISAQETKEWQAKKDGADLQAKMEADARAREQKAYTKGRREGKESASKRQQPSQISMVDHYPLPRYYSRYDYDWRGRYDDYDW